MSRTALATFCELLDAAFDGDSAQSLMANLRGLDDADWTALPPGAGRSIAEHVEHVAWAKWMYADYAFGPATLRGDQPPLVPADGASARPSTELLTWLREGHQHWMAAVRALPDDSELDRERLTNWGERLPTRVILRMQLLHDVYHAGEINHQRALLRGTDRWPY